MRYPDFKKKTKNEELHFKQKDGKILEQNLWQSQEWKSLVTNQGTELVSYFKRNICGKKRGTWSSFSAKDTPYFNSDSDEEFDQEEEENIDELNSVQLSDTKLEAAQSSNTTTINKTVAAPHKKRKVIRSQQQALSHLAASVEQLAASAAKNQRRRTNNWSWS